MTDGSSNALSEPTWGLEPRLPDYEDDQEGFKSDR